MDIHNGERPILCKFCDKPFSNESYLLDHMGIHRDSNPVNYSIDNFPTELLNHEGYILERNHLNVVITRNLSQRKVTK